MNKILGKFTEKSPNEQEKVNKSFTFRPKCNQPHIFPLSISHCPFPILALPSGAQAQAEVNLSMLS